MAGAVRYTALLDANVLYPVALCSTLMSVAETGLFLPKWTARIDEEWLRNLSANTQIPLPDLQRRSSSMHAAYPDWEVPPAAWKALESGLTLPDPDDRHVLAAAIAGHADCIVTSNLKDFPDEVLATFGLVAIHPDSFLMDQLYLDQVRVLAALKRQRVRLKNPAFTVSDFADALERNSLPMLAQAVRDAADLL